MSRQSRMVLGFALTIAVGAAAPAWAGGVTERVSVGPGGVESNGSSTDPAITPDGRFVAFTSQATNLVPGDTNGVGDVFVRDRLLGTTRRVSLGRGGVQSNSFSSFPALSAGGRFVAFDSQATNLVPGDTNNEVDVFVRDRVAGTTTRVSVSSRGAQGNRWSIDPDISGDGRVVAFLSEASNLVSGDTNGGTLFQLFDVFVRDRAARRTTRVNLGPRGVEATDDTFGLALSADGRFVAFDSDATNLVPSDTNGSPDIFVRHRRTGTTRRVSVGAGGVQANVDSRFPAISADGRFVAFRSDATNLVPSDTNGMPDIFVRDRQARRTVRVSVGTGGVQADGFSGLDTPAISADGRFVAFWSDATNLVPGDTNSAGDIFVHDRQTSTTRRVSVGPDGAQNNGNENRTPALSADGRFVAFISNATNLVLGDTNGTFDVFVHTR